MDSVTQTDGQTFDRDINRGERGTQVSSINLSLVQTIKKSITTRNFLPI